MAGGLVWVSRLPRTVAALLTGASLAVAGTVMQMLTRNRFVEPSTAGTAQAAGLGLIAVTLLAPGSSVMIKICAALTASLFGTFGFVAILRRLPPRDPLLVPLVGIVYGGIIGAVASFIAYERDLVQYLDVWTGGELSGVMIGRYETLFLAAALLALVYGFADRFTIAGLGEDISRNLGLNYAQVMALGLSIVATITAVTVVTVGMMPFAALCAASILILGQTLFEHVFALQSSVAIVIEAVGGAVFLLTL